jgi:ubiquinone/menaquinone biosynthesis C-methylase UbiE
VTDWHRRYLQQASWSRLLRNYLFQKANFADASRIIEVGCGTGAILLDLPSHKGALHGVDIDQAALRQCRSNVPYATLTLADALNLPFVAHTFEIAYCHFLLLWLADPIEGLREMRRIVTDGGYVLALSEPDHEARLDRPEELMELGRLQTAALRQQGADPSFGARLADSFRAAGIDLVESGTLQPSSARWTPADRALEWSVTEADLATSLSTRELENFRRIDAEAWEKGERVLHVPTFYACGRA